MKKMILISIFITFFSSISIYPQRLANKKQADRNDTEKAPVVREDPILMQRDIPLLNDRERPQGHPQGHPQRNPIRQDPPPVQITQPEYIQEPVFYPGDEPVDPGYNQPVICDPPGYVWIPPNPVEIIDIEIEPVSLKIIGIENFEDGNYMKALQIFWDALIEDPEDQDLYFYRGCTNVKLGNYLWAIEDLDIYLHEGEPDYINADSFFYKKAYYYRGLAKFYEKDKEGAYSDLFTSAKLGNQEAGIFLKKFY